LGRMNQSRLKHVYEVRPRKDKRGIDLISDVLPFGRLWNVIDDSWTLYGSRCL